MARTFTDGDADLGVLQDRHVAVLGYGSQGRAQALSLRDSGVDVRVGLPAGSASRADAEAEGLSVLPPDEAVEEANTVVMLVPGQAQAVVYAEAVGPNLVEGDALVFAHGFPIRFGLIEPPPEVDVVLVAPQGPGEQVRREYTDGRGVPVLLAVDQDASGLAWDLALAYARAIGGLRGGGVQTTFAEQSTTAMFADQVVGGGVSRLFDAAVATLTNAGYQPEVAREACRLALAGSGESDDAQIAGLRLITPRVEGSMRALLGEIERSGR